MTRRVADAEKHKAPRAGPAPLEHQARPGTGAGASRPSSGRVKVPVTRRRPPPTMREWTPIEAGIPHQPHRDSQTFRRATTGSFPPGRTPAHLDEAAFAAASRPLDHNVPRAPCVLNPRRTTAPAVDLPQPLPLKSGAAFGAAADASASGGRQLAQQRSRPRIGGSPKWRLYSAAEVGLVCRSIP